MNPHIDAAPPKMQYIGSASAAHTSQHIRRSVAAHTAQNSYAHHTHTAQPKQPHTLHTSQVATQPYTLRRASQRRNFSVHMPFHRRHLHLRFLVFVCHFHNHSKTLRLKHLISHTNNFLGNPARPLSTIEISSVTYFT